MNNGEWKIWFKVEWQDVEFTAEGRRMWADKEHFSKKNRGLGDNM